MGNLKHPPLTLPGSWSQDQMSRLCDYLESSLTCLSEKDDLVSFSDRKMKSFIPNSQFYLVESDRKGKSG